MIYNNIFGAPSIVCISAFGGVGEVARAANLNGKTLYRTLSAGGTPQVSTLIAILRTMGLQLAVKPLQLDIQAQAA